MLFKDVIGQQHVKQHLIEMVQQNRLSHALLFLGNEGAGALPLAVAFAQYIVCEKINGKSKSQNTVSLFGDTLHDKEEEDKTDACGQCPACQKAANLVHPDIHFSYPVITKKTGDKPKSTDWIKEWRAFFLQKPYGSVFDWLQTINAENKQGNISAEECNEIIKQLSLKSFESDYKLLIMWMPEYLGKEGNKLLKLIEEPPPNTLFILVAESEDKILQTILSRTQLVKIPLLETNEIEQALVSRNEVEPDQAKQVAAIAQGNYHEALDLLQHAGEDWLQLLEEWLQYILHSKIIEQQKWIEEVAKLGREKQKQFLQYVNHMIEQCVRLRIVGENHTTLTDKEFDFAQRFNLRAGVTQQHHILTEVNNCIYYIERNANAKMLFHALSLKIYYIVVKKHKVTAA